MKKDIGTFRESVKANVDLSNKEKGKWNDRWVIKKYSGQSEFLSDDPYEVNIIENGNELLNSGINEIWRLVAGSSANHFNHENTVIGIGDNDTAVDPEEQTDLLADTNYAYVGMESGYPESGSSQKILFMGIFDGTTANYNWREIVIKNSVTNICLNRLVSNQGTKALNQIWTVSLEVVLT